MKVDEKFVKSNYNGKKFQKKIVNAAAQGDLRAFVKDPITGNAIRVHPDLVKKIKDGETVTMNDILNKKFD